MFLRIDHIDNGAQSTIQAKELTELTDDHISLAMNGHISILRACGDGFERLEFINDLIPNWVEVQPE